MSGDPPNDPGENEVEMVLKALRDLREQVSNPVIWACLEDAYEDIAHLVGRGEDSGQNP
jgi:hypothetical protein